MSLLDHGADDSTSSKASSVLSFAGDNDKRAVAVVAVAVAALEHVFR